MNLLICIALFVSQASTPANPSVKLFQWFDGLGYGQALKQPFVKVLRVPSGSSSKPETVGYGYLLVDRDKSFDVLLTNLAKASYSKVPPERSTSANWSGKYTFERTDLAAVARMTIRHHKNPNLAMDESRYAAFEPFEEFGSDSVLAWLCRRNGLNDESAELVKFGKQWCNSSIPKQEYFRTMRDRVAEGVFGRVILTFGDPSISRAEILPNLREFVARYRDVTGRGRYQAVLELLERMVEEDRNHSKVTKPEQPQILKNRVAELIWQLREHRHWLGYTDEPVSPRDQLVKIGYGAVPQLLDALRDRRFTRQVGHPHSGPPQVPDENSIERISGVAHEILSQIAGRSFQGNDWRDKAAVERNAREWWSKVGAKGEKAILIAGASRGDENSPGQAEKLANIYPADALKPIRKGYSLAKDKNVRSSIVRAVTPLPHKETRPFLKAVISKDPSVAPRLEASKILAVHDPEAGIDAVLRELNRSPKLDSFSFESDSIVEFLLESGRPRVLRALIKELPLRDVHFRHTVVSNFSRGVGLDYPRHFPAKGQRITATSEKEYRGLVEDLLAAELMDRERWGGSMSIGDLQFTGPEMSELATYTLAQCFPGKYRFAKSGSMEERERQRLASLNVYRARRGLAKVRPSTAPPKVKLISSSVVLPLIERFVKEGGKAAQGRLEAHGLGALPYVAKAANEAREPGVKKRLTDLARRMSCILRSAQIENARPGTETKVSQQIRAFVGQVLTTDRLFEILEVLAKGVSRRDARAASFVAERDATQTGFTISIRFTTEISQGGTSVTLNGDWVRSGGGADPSSFMGKIDDYLGSGIHRCLLSDRKTPIDIQVAIAKPFKG